MCLYVCGCPCCARVRPAGGGCKRVPGRPMRQGRRQTRDATRPWPRNPGPRRTGRQRRTSTTVPWVEHETDPSPPGSLSYTGDDSGPRTTSVVYRGCGWPLVLVSDTVHDSRPSLIRIPGSPVSPTGPVDEENRPPESSTRSRSDGDVYGGRGVGCRPSSAPVCRRRALPGSGSSLPSRAHSRGVGCVSRQRLTPVEAQGRCENRETSGPEVHRGFPGRHVPYVGGLTGVG